MIESRIMLLVNIFILFLIVMLLIFVVVCLELYVWELVLFNVNLIKFKMIK